MSYLREHAHEFGQVAREDGVHILNELEVELGELRQVVTLHTPTELCAVGEVPHRQMVGAVDLPRVTKGRWSEEATPHGQGR